MAFLSNYVHILKSWQGWLAGLGLVLLPLAPEVAVGFIALLGFYGLVRYRIRIIPSWVILGSASLFALSQLLAASPSLELPTEIYSDGKKSNLILWDKQFFWQGYEPTSYSEFVSANESGFFTLSRIHPVTKKPYLAILAPEFQTLELKRSQSVTFSFYLRASGQLPEFRVGFWPLRSSPYMVEPKFTRISSNTWRVSATFTPPRAVLLQRVALEELGGDWARAGFAAAQLWYGTNPIPFSLNPTPPSKLLQASGWFGQILLGYLILQGGVLTFSFISSRVAAVTLLFGTFLHFVIAMVQHTFFLSQDSRVSGLTVQPNFLGHLAIISAGLVVILGGRNTGFVASVLAIGLVWFSGSRAAFIGLAGLGLLWLSQFSWRKWQTWLLGVLLAVATLAAKPWSLGRFATIDDIGFVTSQARVQIWGVAMQAFRANPLAGIGLDNFPFFYLNHRPSDAVTSVVSHAHNLVLHLLAGGGILALAAMIILWGWVSYKLAHLRRWGTIGFIGLVVLLNLFDYTWFTAGAQGALWIAVAAGLVATFPDRISTRELG